VLAVSAAIGFSVVGKHLPSLVKVKTKEASRPVGADGMKHYFGHATMGCAYCAIIIYRYIMNRP
jgi:hypothetical protein